MKNVQEPWLTKRQLAQALGRKSTRIVDTWVQKRMISSIKAGHRTRLFQLTQVLADLARFEVKAIGRRD
jgi:hypothetical protein